MNVRFTTSTLISFSIVILLISCATYKPQSNIQAKPELDSNAVVHTFYIAGGMGTAGVEGNPKMAALLKQKLDQAPNNSTLLFTGDYSIYEGSKEENLESFRNHLNLTENFKGHTIFNPGHHEWSSMDTKKIEVIEDYIKDNDLKNIEVEPNNVCPLEYRVLNESIDIIYINTSWFDNNWDGVEGINQKCTDINTKRRFVEELEGYIKDSNGKNLVIVMHHPLYSNGKYAGYQTFGQSITPLPVVGTLLHELKSLGGFSSQYMSSFRYNYMRTIISALAQENDRTTIVSGHEESLQLLTGGDIRQIVSGSLGSATGTKLSEGTIANVGGSLDFEGNFTYGKEGFAILRYYEDGSSEVQFITEDDTHTFDVNDKFPKDKPSFPTPTNIERTKTVPITSDEKKLNKSGFYNWIWGKRYRNYFGVPVTADVAILDTLYRGLKVTKEGGGHQSFSARLADGDGREYAMRGLQKDALKFLKFKVKGIAYHPEEFEGTYAETIVYDFFSTTHPFMQLVINPLAKEAGINHANTQLYYVPKQPGFRILGEDYGDQLYFIEERPNDQQKDYDGYRRALPDEGGEIVNFESTTDVLEKLNEDEKYSIDQKAYIRARIFDMLIGDWDRHEDQWRWAEYEISEDDVRFIPIPRDRDAAFSKFDGIAIPIIKMIMPDVRFWQSYSGDIKNVKWFMAEGNNLDRAFLNKHGVEVWIEEAKKIQEGLTDAEIDDAFMRLPTEVRNEDSNKIKENLKQRLKNIDDIAMQYGQRMQDKVVVHGTHKDDKIEITRMPDGMTKVVIKRLLSDEKNKVFFERTFNSEETEEIWIYGLNDDDEFTVSGDGDHEIMIRLIGGYGEDVFTVSNRKKLKVYDWKYEKTEFTDKTPTKQFTNLYETNTYFWRFFNENRNVFFPNLGFQTDDGLFVGASDTYTNMGFNGEDFRYKHMLSANYFFNFKAVEVEYQGAFANIVPNWQLDLQGYYTSDRFSNNFFGYGNDTEYDEDEVDRDFNRARMQQINFSAGISYRTLGFRGLFENYKVDDLNDRFINDENLVLSNDVFENQNYVGAEAFLEFENADAPEFPTRGLFIGLNVGYKSNIELKDNNFGFVKFRLGFDRKLIQSGNLVLGSRAEVNSNFGNEFFFYHAPSIGGNNGLRGYRNERFTGKTSFFHSSDLKLRVKKFVTAVTPITVGLYGGYDYGRVWLEDDNSDTWHNSVGGGFWVGSLNAFSLNLGYFVSDEDAILQVGLGFGF